MAMSLLSAHCYSNRTGPRCLNIMTLLVEKDVKISNIYAKTTPFFFRKNVRNFCSAKVPYNFLAKYIAEVDFVSSVRLNKSSTKDFVQPAML